MESTKSAVLTEAKLLAIVQKFEGTQKVSLESTEVKPGVAKGQNYLGLVLECKVKANVDGVSKSYHWMAKVPQSDSSKFLWTRGSHLERKEITFYEEFIPSFEKFIAEKQAKIQLTFCPLVYSEFLADVPKDECQKGSILVMDHMGQYDFRDAINKRAGLDMDHIQLVMPELAKFHAVSYAFLKGKHGNPEHMMEKEPIMGRDFMFTNPDEAMAPFAEGFDKGTNEAILGILAYCGPEYRESFKRYLDQGTDPMKLRNRLSLHKEYKFNTLCHGDAWFNNMLFRYEGAKPVQICLLDLAVTRWSSPATDLAYFFQLSTTPELRKAHLDDILELYHQHLTQYLEELGEDPSIIPLAELKADYRKASFMGFMIAVAFLPWMLAPEEDAVGVDEFVGDFSDGNVIQELNDRTKIILDKAAQDDPSIINRLRGAFLEMVKLGHFQL